MAAIHWNRERIEKKKIVLWDVRSPPHSMHPLRAADALSAAVARAQVGNQNCFALERRNSTGGFGLKTREPFTQGEKMVLGPCDKISDARANQLENARGWQSDFKIFHIGAGTWMSDIGMPDLSAYYSPITVNGQPAHLSLLEATPADMDEGARYPWRNGGEVPAGMSKWYFLDHARDPNLTICKDLLKIRLDEGNEYGFFRALVFEAKRDIAAGEWLTYTYEQVPATWVDPTD